MIILIPVIYTKKSVYNKKQTLFVLWIQGASNQFVKLLVLNKLLKSICQTAEASNQNQFVKLMIPKHHNLQINWKHLSNSSAQELETGFCTSSQYHARDSTQWAAGHQVVLFCCCVVLLCAIHVSQIEYNWFSILVYDGTNLYFARTSVYLEWSFKVQIG